MPSIALLTNPDSGQGNADDVERLLREAGAEVTSFRIAEHERAAAAGVDRIAVAGGDGSIACAAGSAARAGVPLAVIPTGTANDFAAALGLPPEVEAACELAVRGETRRPMELAFAGERAFVNIASVGLSPTAAEHADQMKSQFGALAYTFGAIEAGVTADPIHCRVTCDGDLRHEGEVWQISIGSTGAFGGGSSIESNTSDGKLDLVVIEGSSRIRLVGRAYGLKAGKVEAQKGVIHERCAEVELSLPDDECLNIDGELVESGDLIADGTLRFRCEQDAFELIVG